MTGPAALRPPVVPVVPDAPHGTLRGARMGCGRHVVPLRCASGHGHRHRHWDQRGAPVTRYLRSQGDHDDPGDDRARWMLVGGRAYLLAGDPSRWRAAGISCRWWCSGMIGCRAVICARSASRLSCFPILPGLRVRLRLAAG
ncbi:MAG: hypothetical protein ACRDS9_27135 [Pseudonocardiaceae bacterium]